MIWKFNRLVRRSALAGAAAFAAAILFSPAVQAQDARADDGEAIEEVIVTGFRGSLEAALNIKRNAVNGTESIVGKISAECPT